MVLTEAMAAGNPVVALDGPGVREIVPDGDNGWLLPAEAPEGEFTAALAELSRAPEVRDRWRGVARRTAEAYSHEESVEKVLRLYANIKGDRARKYPQNWTLWDKLLRRIEVEWNLLAGKATAAAAAVALHRDTNPELQ